MQMERKATTLTRMVLMFKFTLKSDEAIELTRVSVCADPLLQYYQCAGETNNYDVLFQFISHTLTLHLSIVKSFYLYK